MKNKKWIFLLVLFNISNSYADGTYFLPGSSGGEYSKDLTDPMPEGEKGKVFYIPDHLTEEMMEADAQQLLWAVPQSGTQVLSKPLSKTLEDDDVTTDNHFIMESQKGAYHKELKKKKKSSTQFDQIPQGSGEAQTDKYIESDIFERLNEYRNKGTAAFTLTFFYDGNTYTDGTGIYEETFKGDGAEWYNNVWAVLSSEFYLIKSFFNFALGGNLGAGYKAGNGVFAENGNKSETRFSLVPVVVDASVIFEFNFWNWVRVEAYGGPSIMGLIQGRDDRESDENDKTIGQISWGYFGGARFKLSLGEIFPKSNKSMFQSNDVTNYFVTFDIRYQYYSNFKQDNVQVSGTSGGLGLAFEFL